MSDADELMERIKKGLKEWSDRLDAEAAVTQAYFEGFSNALESEDLTGVLIRGHLYIENEMNGFLEKALPRFKEAKIVKWEFADKLKLLYALGLISLELRNAVGKFNTLRNGTAHMATPGVIPVVTDDMVHQLWNAVGKEQQDLFQGDYSRTDNTAANLRQMIVNIMIMLHVYGDLGEEGVRDMVRYHMTGETVMQRIEAAHRASEHDPEPLRSVKASIRKLQYEQRDDLRIWMSEVYHR